MQALETHSTHLSNAWRRVMKLRVAAILMILQAAAPSVLAQVDCSLLDPRPLVSSVKEGKVQGAVETLYKIAKADVSVEGKLKSEIQNLQQGTASVSEKYAISARMIYLFCGMIANAKDIGTERKNELLRELDARIRELPAVATQPPRAAEGKRAEVRVRNPTSENGSSESKSLSPAPQPNSAARAPSDLARQGSAGIPREQTSEPKRISSENPATPRTPDYRLKFIGFFATGDAYMQAWSSPSGKMIAYCTPFCRSIVVKKSDDMTEVARIDTRSLNSSTSVNPGMFGLGISHDDTKIVISYVTGLDNYRSKPSKAALFNLLRGGEQEWEIDTPLGGIDVLNKNNLFTPDNQYILVGNTTMVETTSGHAVGRFTSGGKDWCALADGSLASYHARTIRWVDSKPVSGQGQYDYLACGKQMAILGTSMRIGDKWKRTAYIAKSLDRASWTLILGDTWDSGEKISPDLRFSVKEAGNVVWVASGKSLGTMFDAVRGSCDKMTEWKPYASDVHWQADGEFLVWESGNFCGRGAGFARFAIN